jgi:nicotinamidase-related amidase
MDSNYKAFRLSGEGWRGKMTSVENNLKEKLMSRLPANAALIVIDVQRAFEDPSWGQRNNPDAEKMIARLLAGWRETNRPVIHVHHRSQRPVSLFYADGVGFQVKAEALPLPGEAVIYKEVNSGFIGTDLEVRLREAGIDTVVMVGITTDHCVSTTTRMAGNLGFDTYVVSDATATFERMGPTGVHFAAQLMHDTALASVNGEFAKVVDTGAVLGML